MFFSPRSVGRYAGPAVCFFALAASCVLAQTASPAPNAGVQQRLLPASFSGWTEKGVAKTGSAPAAIDAANADVLNEYGLKDFAEGTYQHERGEVSLRAMRFVDATGAYGAFTFYCKPDMKPEAIGNGAAGDAHEIVFWAGVTVVDATFDSSSALMAPSLKVLSAALPHAAGSSSVAPTLPDYLPANSLDKATVRYAIGPAAYARSGGVLPPDAIDFSRDAEAVTARYSARGGRGTLTLIEYPTPQMAVGAEKNLGALLKGQPPATLQQSNPAALAVKRSGPLVAVTSGDFSSAEVQALLAQVKYQADVTWNRGEGSSGNEVRNAGKMLLGIAYLTGVVVACAFVLGIFLGGGRAVWRVMHGKPVSTVYEEDFISLNLNEWPPGSAQKLP